MQNRPAGAHSRFDRIAGHPLFCLALVVAHLTLGISANRWMGVTTDEPAHLIAGYMILSQGDFRVDPIHPPLARMAICWPLLLQQVKAPKLTAHDLAWVSFWPAARRWINQDNKRIDLLRWPRAVNQCITATAIVLVWLVLRRRRPAAAGMAAFVIAFEPTILAHGGLATTDAAVVLLLPLAVFCFWRCLRCVTVGRLLAAAVAVSAVVLVKFSGLLIVGISVLCAAAMIVLPATIHWRIGWRRVCRGRLAKLGASVAVLVFLAAFGFAAIWACYLFRYSAGPTGTTLVAEEGEGPYLPEPAWLFGEELERWPVRLVIWSRRHRVLPEAYLNGVNELLRAAGKRSTFLLGWGRGGLLQGGSLLYFPIAFLVKTPVPAMALMLAGIALFVSRAVRARWRTRAPTVILPAAVAALFYAAVAIASRVNIGYRHFLPVLPLLLVATAPYLARWARATRPNLGFVLVLGFCQLAIVAYRWPDYLPFFNLLIGGPNSGQYYLGDSNLDWGQDLPRLAEYVRRRTGPPIKLAYFGSDWPSRLDLDVTQLVTGWEDPNTPPAELSPGTYVASVTALQGVLPLIGPYELAYRQCQQAIVQAGADGVPPSPDLIAERYRLACHRILWLLRKKLWAEQYTARITPALVAFELNAEEIDAALLGVRVAPPD